MCIFIPFSSLKQILYLWSAKCPEVPAKLKVVSLPSVPTWYCKHPDGGLQLNNYDQLINRLDINYVINLNLFFLMHK